jgi:hypothetical protein
VLVLDLLVPQGWTDQTTVRTSTHGYPGMLESLIQRLPDFDLPFTENATYLGTEIDALDSPDVPRYPEMMRSVLGELGWAGTTFDIYRCRVQYPIMHTLLHMTVETVGEPNSKGQMGGGQMGQIGQMGQMK